MGRLLSGLVDGIVRAVSKKPAGKFMQLKADGEKWSWPRVVAMIVRIVLIPVLLTLAAQWLGVPVAELLQISQGG